MKRLYHLYFQNINIVLLAYHIKNRHFYFWT